MSREDKRKANPTPEERFFSGIQGVPLKDWEKGREFIAADDKALLIFDGIQPEFFPDSVKFKGKILKYDGLQHKMSPAGVLTASIIFSDDFMPYVYDTGKPSDTAPETLFSNEIPMLIDRQLIEEAANLLKGKQLWTRSNLWYDENEQRIDGKKYVEVVVENVDAGNLAFPLKLTLRTLDNEVFNMFMNLGNSDTESRAFHNLFSISDIKKHYPDISPEFWDLICNGKVSIGMTKQECRLALGNPIETSSGHDYSQTLDIWSYDNGKVLWFEDGKLVRFKG